MSSNESDTYMMVGDIRVKNWSWQERLARKDNQAIMEQSEKLGRRLACNVLDCYDLLIFCNFDEERVAELAPKIVYQQSGKVQIASL